VSTWGRSDPTDEEDESGLQLEHVTGQPARWRMAIAAICAILALGVLWAKPWDRPVPAPVALLPSLPAQVSATSPPATLRPTPEAPDPSPTPEAPDPGPTRSPIAQASRLRHCVAPRDWKLLSSESTQRWTVRTLWAAAPTAATGPTDPDLPVRVVHADNLLAVGICPPRTPVLTPSLMLRDVVLWQVLADGHAREVTRPGLFDSALYDLGEAYFGPPAGEGKYWPAGRYVFQIRRLAGAGSRWMGLEFVPTRS